jgi:putative FmdB family regulatory protein
MMPVYDYLCDACGPFTDMRPMAECDDPQACPKCEDMARRAILTAPNFFCMPAERRKSFATNERSQHAPQPGPCLALYSATGCGCCSPKKPPRLMTKSKSGAKGFPSARPWMISH